MGRHKANIFEKFLFKIGLKKPNYTLTDEDRKNALLLRQERAAIKLEKLQLEKAKIAAEKEKLHNDIDPEQIMGKFLNHILENMMTGNHKRGAAPRSAPVQNGANSSLLQYETVGKAEIKAKLQTLPSAHIQFLKNKTDDELRVLAKEHLNLSGHNLETAIEVLREW